MTLIAFVATPALTLVVFESHKVAIAPTLRNKELLYCLGPPIVDSAFGCPNASGAYNYLVMQLLAYCHYYP